MPVKITDERSVEAVKEDDFIPPTGTLEIKLSKGTLRIFGTVDVQALRGVGVSGRMIALPAGTRIWIAAAVTDLRRGFTGWSGMVQNVLEENPFSGHVFVFSGRRGT